MRKINELDVFSNSELVGRLSRKFSEVDGLSLYSFQYEEGATTPISVLLPVRSKPYKSTHLHTIFQTGLPEGSLLRAIMFSIRGVIFPDDIGLLCVSGQNRIGALQCVEPGTRPLSQSELKAMSAEEVDSRYRLNISDVTAYIESLMIDCVNHSGVSGSEPKLLGITQDKIVANSVSSIIKMDSVDNPFISANEYFCLKAGRASGMVIADAKLIMDGRGVSITRFDVTESGRRLGFEDVRSLMGLNDESNYAATTEEVALCIANVLGNQSTAASDALVQLFTANVFSTAIRNSDAHLKNFGILFDGEKEARLSPIFDLVTTVVYPGVHNRPALKTNNKLEWCDRGDFVLVGKNDYKLSFSQIDATFKSVEQGINAVANEVAHFCNQERQDGLVDLLGGVLLAWSAGLKSLDMKSHGVDEAIQSLLDNQSVSPRSNAG